MPTDERPIAIVLAIHHFYTALTANLLEKSRTGCSYGNIYARHTCMLCADGINSILSLRIIAKFSLCLCIVQHNIREPVDRSIGGVRTNRLTVNSRNSIVIKQQYAIAGSRSRFSTTITSVTMVNKVYNRIHLSRQTRVASCKNSRNINYLMIYIALAISS